VRRSKRILTPVFISLAIALSMFPVASPAHAQSIIFTPGGTTIEVGSGQVFVLSHRLSWDQHNFAGGYFVTISWDCPKDEPWRNFKFVGASAYFVTGDYAGENIRAEVVLSKDISPENENVWRYTVQVRDLAFDDYRNGEFNVDIKLRAANENGIPHIATDNHPIFYPAGGVSVAEGENLTQETPDPITIRVLAWTGGVVARGKENAYATDNPNTPPPFVLYAADNRPPIMAAQRVGAGGVLALGISPTLDDGKWNDAANLAPHLDVLLDIAFQWMKPGAKNVLWYTGYGVARKKPLTEGIEDALAARGYNVVEDGTQPIDDALLAPYDIVVIPGLMLGDSDTGGDPSLLPDNDVEAIKNFVENGGGLAIFESGDNASNFYRVSNKILKALDFGWYFQSDSIVDDVNNWGGEISQLIVEVDNSTAIGGGYVEATGKATIGVYQACSLIPRPSFGVNVSVSPSENRGSPGYDVTFTVTVTNTGSVWDTYSLTVGDALGWSKSLSKTSVTLQPGQSEDIQLVVTIDPGSTHSTRDNITVLARGFHDPTVVDSENCVAHTWTLGVYVSISPPYRSGFPGETLTYTVIVQNTGKDLDNYLLDITDSLGWGPAISRNFLTLAPGASDNATLTVTVPEGAAPCILDNIVVTAISSIDPAAIHSNYCLAHRSKVTFELVNLYKVSLDLELYLAEGSALVVRFYSYAGAYQAENIFWTGTTPEHVVKFENVPHPENRPVERIELILVLNGSGRKLASFTVNRGRLINRILQIKARWPYAFPPERSLLFKELADISSKWPYAPS
jgi:hypothetical protein